MPHSTVTKAAALKTTNPNRPRNTGRTKKTRDPQLDASTQEKERRWFGATLAILQGRPQQKVALGVAPRANKHFDKSAHIPKKEKNRTCENSRASVAPKMEERFMSLIGD